MSRLLPGLRAFLLNPTQPSAAVIHAARLGEQMFPFCSTHGGGALCRRLSGVQSKNPTPGGAPSLFSSAPPTCIPNDDVILFRPSSHMAQTGCALLSMWKHFDSHSLPIPHLPLSPSPRRHALPSGHVPADVHPSWLFNMAVTLAVIKSYSRPTNPLLWSYKLLTFPATE